MFRTRTSLSNLEQLVLSALWKRDSATSEEIREALSKRHPMKQSTTRTILVRLEEKGYVRHRVEGRTHVYSASEPPSNVAVKAVEQIIRRFCGGSVERLMTGMVDNQV